MEFLRHGWHGGCVTSGGCWKGANVLRLGGWHGHAAFRVAVLGGCTATQHRVTVPPVLGDAGYEVDTAATGREGLDRAVAGQFDLVMTDLRLPDLNGMDLVRALRTRRPEVPIVIITGYGSVPNAVEAVKLGVLDYIEKPFTPEQITEAVGRAVAAHPEGHVRIEADAVREVLRRATREQDFGQRLLTQGSRVLSGYALSPQTQAAVVSGDIAWIEKEFGTLTPEERQWLEHRLEAEIW